MPTDNLIGDKFREVAEEIQRVLDEIARRLGIEDELATANGAPISNGRADEIEAGRQMQIEGGGGGASRHINWSWRSRPTFGHTFTRHGAGANNTQRLRGRAATGGQPQGQWVNNEQAAAFLQSIYQNISGSTIVDIPAGLGQVIMPDGSILPATRAQIVPREGGVYRTAFPVLENP